MLIMYLMHRRNKNKGAEVWVQKDVGAVDLTPWKYSKIVSVIVIVCVLLVYLAFSPGAFSSWQIFYAENAPCTAFSVFISLFAI